MTIGEDDIDEEWSETSMVYVRCHFANFEWNRTSAGGIVAWNVGSEIPSDTGVSCRLPQDGKIEIYVGINHDREVVSELLENETVRVRRRIVLQQAH